MSAIEIVEVGARDGLQNEAVLFTTSQKLELIGLALAAGVRRIEATSFVNAKLVPQMADAEAVAAGLPRRDSADEAAGRNEMVHTPPSRLSRIVASAQQFGLFTRRETHRKPIEL